MTLQTPAAQAPIAALTVITVAWRAALTILALFATLGALPLAAAAAAAAKVEDTIAQRVQACTGCHGAQGRAASDGYYPRLAGKPAGYLYQQLLSFRDGRRQYGLMNNLLAPLSDAYLREIAQHFADLDVPYLPPLPASADAATLARGATLVRDGDATRQIPACVQCHGTALMGVAPGVPALIGMPRDYLNAQLGAWRAGNRHAAAPDCMAQIAKALAPDDISALSHWLAAQAVPLGAKAAPAPTSATTSASTSAQAARPPLRCGSIAEPTPTPTPTTGRAS